MKIAQITQRFFYGGGQERHVYHISRELVKKGHKVKIFTSDCSKSDVFSKEINLEGIKVIKANGRFLDIPTNQVVFTDLLSKIINEDIDIIHAHGALCQASQLGFIASRIKKIPFVFTPHFHPWWVYDDKTVRRSRRALEKMTTAPLLENANAVIAISPFEKELLIDKYKIVSSKIAIIANGVDMQFLAKTILRDNIRKKFNIPDGKKYVLFFGSIADLRKGIERIISIFKNIHLKIDNAHLIIIGWQKGKTGYILEKIKEAGLKDNISLVGYINEEEKVAFLKMASISIAPTIYEAFGITLAESMFLRVPVVATKAGGIPSVVRDRETGYLVSNYKSIDKFSKYAIRLLMDEKLRIKMGEKGHLRAKEKFKWSAIAWKIERLFKRLIKKNDSMKNNS